MRLPHEDQRHYTFWRQLLHAVAADAPPRATLTAERKVYDDERRIALHAELRDDQYKPLNDATVDLTVTSDHRRHAHPDDDSLRADGDGRYRAIVDADPAGLYRVVDERAARRGDARRARDALPPQRRRGGALRHATESCTAGAHRRGDGRPLLAARRSGGLPDAMRYSKAGIVERQTLDLWNLPAVFLLLLAPQGGRMAAQAQMEKAVSRNAGAGAWPPDRGVSRGRGAARAGRQRARRRARIRDAFRRAGERRRARGRQGRGRDEQRHAAHRRRLAPRDRSSTSWRNWRSKLAPADQVLVALIGHGTYDGEEYRINLPGPDITGTELARLFDRLPAQPAAHRERHQRQRRGGGSLEACGSHRDHGDQERRRTQRHALRASTGSKRSAPPRPIATRTRSSPRPKPTSSPRARSPTSSRRTPRSRPSIRGWKARTRRASSSRASAIR